MDLPAIPLLDLLRQRMSWLNSRQSVLSQNVSNVDTPGYRAQDLKPLDFSRLLAESRSTSGFSPSLAVTNPRHIAKTSLQNVAFAETSSADTEPNPTGNTVSLEQEMMKVADTQAQFKAAANLYAKAVGLMRTAIGRP
jgi:flagellar basal-body rod protein FlgB